MGLISDDAAFTTHPKAVKKIRFEDPIHEADMDVKELKNKSDFVLVLSHMGVEQGMQLGKKVKDVDVIIGGHDHRALASFKSGKDKACILIDHKTPFCVTGPNGKVLGRLDMSVDGKKVKYQNSKLIPITSDIEDDPTVAATVKTYADKMHKKYGRVIGEAKENLESSREAQNKLGHLVAESIRVKTGADVGLMNSGGLRTSIKKGPITIGNIVEVSPFQNSLVLLEVTGKEIFDIMNFSFSNQKRGGYPQVAGLEFELDENGKPTNFKISGKSVDPDKKYLLGTHDFLTSGGDGYTILKTLKVKKDFKKCYIRDAVVKYIEKRKVIP